MRALGNLETATQVAMRECKSSEGKASRLVHIDFTSAGVEARTKIHLTPKVDAASN